MSFYANMYQDKLCKPADAAKLVEDGKNLVMGMGAAMPPVLMGAIAERVKAGEFTRLPVYYMARQRCGGEDSSGAGTDGRGEAPSAVHVGP